MTVKEFLVTTSGIESVGIYDEQDQVLDSEVSAISILHFLDCRIHRIKIFNVHTTRYDKNGEAYHSTMIRACILINTEGLTNEQLYRVNI